jgi:hypothetical protein
MATNERLILRRATAFTDTTGIGQTLAGLARAIVDQYAPAQFWEALRDTARLTLSRSFTESHAPQTTLQSIIDDLDRLNRRADYSFRPSKHAKRSARFYILETYARMGRAFPRPSFVLDGERGIVIKWERGGHTVRLNCFGDPRENDYIYFENNEYDTEDDVTPNSLQKRLIWLLKYE